MNDGIGCIGTIAITAFLIFGLGFLPIGKLGPCFLLAPGLIFWMLVSGPSSRP